MILGSPGGPNLITWFLRQEEEEGRSVVQREVARGLSPLLLA